MTTAEKPMEGAVRPFICAGIVVAVLTTPLNLVAILWSWSVIDAVCGSDFRDNNAVVIIVFAGVINAGLYLALCAGSEAVFKLNHLMVGGSFVTERRVAVIVVLVLQLGYLFWESFTIGRLM